MRSALLLLTLVFLSLAPAARLGAQGATDGTVYTVTYVELLPSASSTMAAATSLRTCLQ